ncbi:MAG TPA: hypothetical protein VHX38_09570 [Pseudonocardiaceae bacterium]|nr:hypothetical protein [Pseudonocardiaceae bacterium]
MPIQFLIVLSALAVVGLWASIHQVRITLYHRHRNALINNKIDELFGPGFGPQLPTGRHRLIQGGRHQLRQSQA